MSESDRQAVNSKLRIVVVGGVAGGASAAARARRCNAQAEITILEKGPVVSFANCGLPYHIGGGNCGAQQAAGSHTRALLGSVSRAGSHGT